MTIGILSLNQLDLKDKTVFMRVDFNVPIGPNGEITDDTRIQAALPSINFILNANAKLILASHLGRPKGKPEPRYSLEPVATHLANLLNCEVLFPEQVTGEPIKKLASDMKEKQIMLLENLRFDPGEKSGDPTFAQQLAELADIYVDDAFGAAHRKHASVYTMVQHFDRHSKAAGLLLHRELEALSKVSKSPKKPFVAVMGGAKVSDKIGVITSLLHKADAIIVGGAMAYTFLKALGHAVGSSRIEDEQIQVANEALTEAKRLGKSIILPIDHLVAAAFDTHDETLVTTTSGVDIPDGQMGLDIGPLTIDLYTQTINKAVTLFWNGPMGVFENPLFAKGTMAIAEAIAESPKLEYSVVGGGDSVAALNASGKVDKIDHVSTGGGASLQFIEGVPLPGVEALRANHPFDL